MSEKSGVSKQVLSLPSGGGEVQGSGGAFATQKQTGAGQYSLPITVPDGRNGLQPTLELTYSSGNGDSEFGLGWALGVPAISRKTKTGVPVYDDDKDTFLLSGAKDLVPIKQYNGDDGTTVTRYRPRIEGEFARIEHHRSEETDHWTVESKDGTVRRYATPGRAGEDPAIVADPDDRSKVFKWQLTETVDPFGNRIEYEYARETGDTDHHHWDQLYLDQIRYVDYETETGETQFLVTVDYEYEDRPEPFSRYRSGFEIRTRKRCSRIVIRTQADTDRPIRSYELTYTDELPDENTPANGTSQLAQIQVVGHDDGETQRLPPVEFDYSQFDPEGRDFEALKGPLPRRSLAAPELELADLQGDGLPDIVEIDDEVRYWRNVGDGEFDGPRPMKESPAGLTLADPDVQLMDADGNGRIDLATFDTPLSGYFPLESDGGWSEKSFQPYERVPSVDLHASNVEMLDLVGDGVTDVLRSGNSLEYFFQDADEGWNDTRIVSGALDGLDQLDFSDPRMRLGDLSGDSLQDIVMVDDGHVSYWPNLGHGDWGRRVWMRNPPDLPRDHDPERVLLGDVDGDGLADIIYVEDDRVTLWMNRCGNGWSDPLVITGTPSVTNTDAIRLVDIEGDGIGGILYSGGGRPGSDEMYFLDPIGDQKPYLMTETRNGIGSSVKIEYAPSTQFYLKDQREGTGWKTTLPKPTWVVAREESFDRITEQKATRRYRYHHGHWDGVEREFWGFGMVEERDTEAFDAYNTEGLHDEESFSHVTDREQFSPPTLSKTWFHLGAVGPKHGDWEELDYEDEYWDEDPRQLSRSDETWNLLRQLNRRDRRDAIRTLAGKQLRSEVYALDGSARADRPYRVSERAYGLREEVASEDGPDDTPVFFPHTTGARTTDWERSTDPRTQFSFVSGYDAYGQTLGYISIACPQGWRHDRPYQTSDYQATHSTLRYAYETDDRYIVDRIAERRSYLVVDDTSRTVDGLWSAIEDGSVRRRLTGLSYHYYDGPAFQGKPLGEIGEYGAQVRAEELVLTDQLARKAYAAGDGHPDAAGVPEYLESASPDWSGEYPDDFRAAVPERAGYVERDIRNEAGISEASEGYFRVSRQVEFDFQTTALDTERGLVRRRRDPLDRETTILQYDPYDMTPLRAENPAGHESEAKFDYSSMQYWQATGPNGNRSQVEFSPAGHVTARINLGDPDKEEGDTPAQPSIRYEYNFDAFREGPSDKPKPAYVHTIRRKRHRWDLIEKLNEARRSEGDDPLSETQVEQLFEDELNEHPERFVQERTYMDGSGDEVQTRRQAEADVFTDSDGDSVLPADISETPDSTVVGQSRVEDDPRVRVSEWRTYNNKGNVVEAFEPFYDTGWAFTSRAEARREHPAAFERKVDVHYDALDRRVRTVGLDGSENRIVRGDPSPDLSDPDTYEPTPWVQYQYGTVDNAGRTHGSEARSYDHRWDTPTSSHIDLGERKQTVVTRNRHPDDDASSDVEKRRTTIQYDPWAHTVTSTDELGRAAIARLPDLSGNTLRVENLDAGTSWQCYDATGELLEQRDAKGALRLQAPDEHGRPNRTWARDQPAEAVSLRQQLVYGDELPLDRQTARDRNLLGNVHKRYDEGGLVTVDAYDFTDAPEAVTQEHLGDDVVAGDPVDWATDPNETRSDRERALLSGREYEMRFEHDALGRLQEQQYPEDVTGSEMTLEMEYTPSGALNGAELVVDPGTDEQTRERYLESVGRDSKERPTVVAYGNDVLVRSAYDETTKRLRRQRTETYSSEEGATSEMRLTTTGTVFRDIAYTYDVGGNVLQSREEATGVGVAGGPQTTHDGRTLIHSRDTLVRTFEYDAVGQLRRATGRECTSIAQPRRWGGQPQCGFNDFEGTPDVGRTNAPDQTAMYTEEYEYDPAGNIRSLRHTQHTTEGPQTWTRQYGYADTEPENWDPSPGEGPAGPVRLTHVGEGSPAASSPTHTYDDAGNLETERNARYGWDYADRLRSYREVKNDAVSIEASYAYASSGQRTKKVVNKGDHQREVTEYVGGMLEYHRLESDRTAADGGTVTENNTVHVAGVARKRVGTPFGEEVSFEQSDQPAVQYQYSDRTGGTSLVVDGDGSWANREEYTPFGETTFGGFKHKRYRYAGSERDEESDLYYQGARYYAPWLCRWTTTDPAGPRDGLNVYAYVANDPVNRTDPKGTNSSEKQENPGAGDKGGWVERKTENSTMLSPKTEEGEWVSEGRLDFSVDDPESSSGDSKSKSQSDGTKNGSSGTGSNKGSSGTTGGTTSGNTTGSDLIDFTAGFLTGVGKQLKGMLVGVATAVTSPIDTVNQLLDTTSKAYDEGGGGWSGFQRAFNKFNPVMGLLKSGYKAKLAWEKGQMGRAGEMTANSAASVLDTVGTAMGGASVVKKGLSKAARGGGNGSSGFKSPDGDGRAGSSDRGDGGGGSGNGSNGGGGSSSDGGSNYRDSETTTPWGRPVRQRTDIDWDLSRPDGGPNYTNRYAAKENGAAPYVENPRTGELEKVELHHSNQMPFGRLVEVPRGSHRPGDIDHDPLHGWRPDDGPNELESWRKLHEGAEGAYNKERKNYWKWRAGADEGSLDGGAYWDYSYRTGSRPLP